jgi:hypothetical protein
MGVSNKTLAVTDVAVGLASITLGACAHKTPDEIDIIATIETTNIAATIGDFVENRSFPEFMWMRSSEMKKTTWLWYAALLSAEPYKNSTYDRPSRDSV